MVHEDWLMNRILEVLRPKNETGISVRKKERWGIDPKLTF